MELSSAPQLDKRKTFLDFLRIIATYMVLFNHTGVKGFVFFTTAQYSNFYPFYLFAAVFIKIAVPLFFMISGALLLGKQETFRDLLTKRFFKYLIVLVIASLNLYIYTCLRMNNSQVSISYFLKALYSGKITTAYWYLYAYLAFLLVLPLLRKLANAMNNSDYKWMLILYTMLGLVQILQYLCTSGSIAYSSHFNLFISQNYIFYPLIGYYFDQRVKIEKISNKKVLLLWILSFIAISISCLMTHYKCTITGDWRESVCQTFFNTFIFVPTITVFVTAKSWFANHSVSESVKKIISKIGGATFGIYLIERICRVETEPVFTFLKPYIHTFPACIVWILSACLFGGFIVLLLKKISGVNKFI